MKCGTCGAIGSSAAAACDFCGNQLASTQAAGSGAPAAGVKLNFDPNEFGTYVKDSVAMLGDLRSSPSSGFRWTAFFFPIGYLWGYGAEANAKRVALLLLLPLLLVWVIRSLVGSEYTLSLQGFLLFAGWFWSLYVAYMVATRTDVLRSSAKPFNTGAAVVVQVVALFIQNFLTLSLKL